MAIRKPASSLVASPLAACQAPAKAVPIPQDSVASPEAEYTTVDDLTVKVSPKSAIKRTACALIATKLSAIHYLRLVYSKLTYHVGIMHHALLRCNAIGFKVSFYFQKVIKILAARNRNITYPIIHKRIINTSLNSYQYLC